MKKALLFFLVVIFAAVGFVVISLQPVSSSIQPQQFVINQGDSLNLIASRLYSSKLVRSRYVFIIWSYLKGLNRRLQAGSFELLPSLSTPDIVLKLSTGGSHDYWLTIIGGSRREEISPPLTGASEGYLFPDSYLVPRDFTPSEILEVINQNFQKKFAQAKLSQTTSLTDSETLVLASLLEREARLLPTKQMIAGILLNRLQINMALQVDASVQYARDNLKKPTKYWQPVTKADLKISSPFNTYLYPGLPPAPICNPGYDSIFAAFHPTPSKYLFYITDDSGQIHYAQTLDEHNANIAKYLR